MKQSLKNQYLTALDVSVIALHWAAVPWERVAPGVAAQIRKIANSLAERAAAIRFSEDTPPTGTQGPGPESLGSDARTELFVMPDLGADATPTPITKTEIITKIYGDKLPE